MFKTSAISWRREFAKSQKNRQLFTRANFPAIEIAPKIAANIARVNGP